MVEPARRTLVSLVFLAVALTGSALSAATPPTSEPWLTPVERADFNATPSDEETRSFLKSVAARMPTMRLVDYGRSAQGRPMPLVILSADHAFTPAEAHRNGKPIVLVQNGIHAGEIDGNDACLMLLRDFAEGKHKDILDKVTILIMPIYNVDGHERISKYNRANQDGPRDGQGFRTTTDGLDLNRDYLKIVAPEAQNLIRLVNDWQPHLHIDNHVTDGVVHDWVLTWSWAEAPQAPAPIDAWLRAHMPAALAATEKAGHRTGPYVDLVQHDDPSKGFSSWIGQPRYSTGYFPLRNRPSLLVETLSYAPYKARVLATRDFVLSVLAEVAKDPAALPTAVKQAEDAVVALGRANAAPSTVPLIYSETEVGDPIKIPLHATERVDSVVTGAPLFRYLPTTQEMTVPWFHHVKASTVARPRGYLVMPGWPMIEARLRGQGLRVEEVTEPLELDVETLRISQPTYDPNPYQGQTRVHANATRASEHRKIPAGTLWIPADQPDFELAVQLLEPEAVDSLFAWGFLSSVHEQKEGASPWVLESVAKKLLEQPEIAARWKKALEDPKFAADPRARASWWYRASPYWDEEVDLLPYYRAMTGPSLKTKPWH
jgi:murein tripeptide amidase MpaA